MHLSIVDNSRTPKKLKIYQQNYDEHHWIVLVSHIGNASNWRLSVTEWGKNNARRAGGASKGPSWSSAARTACRCWPKNKRALTEEEEKDSQRICRRCRWYRSAKGWGITAYKHEYPIAARREVFLMIEEHGDKADDDRHHKIGLRIYKADEELDGRESYND